MIKKLNSFGFNTRDVFVRPSILGSGCLFSPFFNEGKDKATDQYHQRECAHDELGVDFDAHGFEIFENVFDNLHLRSSSSRDEASGRTSPMSDEHNQGIKDRQKIGRFDPIKEMVGRVLFAPLPNHAFTGAGGKLDSYLFTLLGDHLELETIDVNIK